MGFDPAGLAERFGHDLDAEKAHAEAMIAKGARVVASVTDLASVVLEDVTDDSEVQRILSWLDAVATAASGEIAGHPVGLAVVDPMPVDPMPVDPAPAPAPEAPAEGAGDQPAAQ